MTPSLPPPAIVASAPAAHVTHAPGDPLEGFNRRMFKIHQGLDRAVLRPAAMGYKHVLPKFLRSGLRHFFSNLGEPIVFANFVLQLKPLSAARTAVRFLINSTVGVAGTVDVAKSKAVELPHHPNSFGDTLGFYGVKPGPYLFLPLVGPSDLRDFAAGQADALLLPVAIGKPFTRLEYQIPKAVITGLDERAQADSELRALFADALDPYATLRSVYLQDRAGEIADLKGKAPDTGIPDDPGGTSSPAPPAELADPLVDPSAAPATAPDTPAQSSPEPSAAAPQSP